MELREIGQTLSRRWWIPCAAAIVVSILGIFQLLYFPIQYMFLPDDDYQVVMRMLVGVTPAPASQSENYDYDPRYFAWLISEYLVDDFTQVVKSGLFAKRVSARLEDQNIIVEPDLIQGASQTGHWHRIITLLFTGNDKEELFAIAEAAHAELEENASFYFYQLGTDDSRILLLDDPIVRDKEKTFFEDGQGEFSIVETNLLSEWLPVFLSVIQRMIAAFVVGTGLIFVLDYLEGTIYGRRPLEAMEISVLAMVPSEPEPRSHLAVDSAQFYWNKITGRYRREKEPVTIPKLSES